MASIEELYKKTEFAKLPITKDKTPISAKDFDTAELEITEQQLEKARGGKLGNGNFTFSKPYSSSVKR